MRKFQLLTDAVRMSAEEAIMRLSVIYRVWQALVLDLGVEPGQDGASGVIAFRLAPTLSIAQLREYVARAEFESIVSAVVHGRPTGMGAFQLEAIRLQFGERVAEHVITHIATVYERIGGLGPSQGEQADALANLRGGSGNIVLIADEQLPASLVEPGANIDDAKVAPIVQGNDSHARSNSTTVP